MTKVDTIKEFTKLNGVGKAKAELLYSSGFTTMGKLKKATAADLTKIKGITEKNSKDILDQFKKEEKTTEKPKAKTGDTKKTTKIKPAKEKPKKEISKPKEEVEIVEEDEEKGYIPKKKPVLTDDIKEKLVKRKQIKKRTPEFLREEWFRYKRIPKNWRRPDGISSKMRRNFKYRPSRVRVGFRGPKETRGFHSSGFIEILIHNVNDLELIDPKTQAARIGGTVGTKKRIEISKRAEELEIRILNMKV